MKSYITIFSIAFALIGFADDTDKSPAASAEAAKSVESESSQRKETLPFGLKSSMTLDEIKGKLKEKSFLTFDEVENVKASGIKNVIVRYSADNFDINGTKIIEVHIFIFNSKIRAVSLYSEVNTEAKVGLKNLQNFHEFFSENNYITIFNTIDEITKEADLDRSDAVSGLKASVEDGVNVKTFSHVVNIEPFASTQSIEYEVKAVLDEMIALSKEINARKNSDTLDKLK